MSIRITQTKKMILRVQQPRIRAPPQISKIRGKFPNRIIRNENRTNFLIFLESAGFTVSVPMFLNKKSPIEKIYRNLTLQ